VIKSDVRREITDVYRCLMGWFPPTGVFVPTKHFQPSLALALKIW